MAAPERWDEACFAVPALRALVAAGLGVGVLCRAGQAWFWQSLPGVEVIPFAAKATAKAVAANVEPGWQAALTWEPNTAAQAIARAGIAKRVGPQLRPLRRWATRPVPTELNPSEHRVRHYLAVIEAMGVATRDPAFFAPAATPPASTTCMLAPDSDFGPNHEWPPGAWRELLARLLDTGRHVAVRVDGSAGRGLGDHLAREFTGQVNGIAMTSFEQLPALVATHPWWIAADGSLPHLAGHFGATCVTLFGPNDPTWKRPLGRRHVVVRRHVECAPCLLAKCPLDLRCQRELLPERVWQAAEERMKDEG